MDLVRETPDLESIDKSGTAISGNHALDDAVIDALPPSVTYLSANTYGQSAWSTTASIETREQNGSILRFFVKYATGDHGRAQLEGEFKSMQEIKSVNEEFVPKPYAFGQLRSANSPTYFFLCEFVDITNSLPDPKALGRRLADFHRKSESPTGMFGFEKTTYDGKLPQKTDWNPSWPDFFADLLLHIAQLDAEVNGKWPDLQTVLDKTVKRVIPRLLGALGVEGRTIKPMLIHGDLWEGNIGTDRVTGNLYVFDAASYYAHNEMELGIWRCDHHRLKSKAYKIDYLRNFEASEPVDEWDDRNRLYSVKTQLMYSAHVPGSNVRHSALKDLEYLIDKYGASSKPADL